FRRATFHAWREIRRIADNQIVTRGLLRRPGQDIGAFYPDAFCPRRVTLTLAEESQLPDTANEEQVAVLITVLGNLIENALDAMEGQPEGEIGLLLHYQNGWL
ncbi:hypothetical protein ACOJCA_00495, partial [Enterobacter sp. BH2-YP2023]